MSIMKYDELPLEEFQYQLGPFKFGRKCGMTVDEKGPQVQDPDFDEKIMPVIYGDGEMHGASYYRGQSVMWDFNILAPSDMVVTPGMNAHQDLADHSSIWNNRTVRQTPNLYMELRYRRHNRIRRMIGRPVKFKPVYGRVTQGWIPVTAEFRKRDHLFYGEQRVERIKPSTPSSGGAVWPLTWPVTWEGAGFGEGEQTIVVEGQEATPVSFRIHGPRSKPGIIVRNQWWFQLDLDLGPFDYVDVIADPWDQGVIRNDTEDVDGALTADSQWLRDMLLLPGSHAIGITGLDPTGSSYVDVSWAEAYTDL
jgi:hypothetical protein